MKGQREKREGLRVKAEGKKSKTFILKIYLVNKRSMMQKTTSVFLSVALEGIMSHDVSIVQSAREYFDTSL